MLSPRLLRIETPPELTKRYSSTAKAEDISPQGGVEPAIICMGGVVANAVYDVTGASLFQLPMTPERVIQALASRAQYAVPTT